MRATVQTQRRTRLGAQWLWASVPQAMGTTDRSRTPTRDPRTAGGIRWAPTVWVDLTLHRYHVPLNIWSATALPPM